MQLSRPGHTSHNPEPNYPKCVLSPTPPSPSHSPFGSGLFKPSRFGMAHAPTPTWDLLGPQSDAQKHFTPQHASSRRIAPIPTLTLPVGGYILAHQCQGLQRRRLLHTGAIQGGSTRGGRELLHAVAAEAAQALLGALAKAAQELLQPRRRRAAALAARWPPQLPGWRGRDGDHQPWLSTTVTVTNHLCSWVRSQCRVQWGAATSPQQ